jgi:mycoredoxin
MADITVYWRPLCGYCEVLKGELDRRGLRYSSVDIWQDRRQAEVVRAVNRGDELVPTVRVGNEFLINPSIDALVERVSGAG